MRSKIKLNRSRRINNVGVFIHWDANDDKRIYEYNYKATKEAIERAVKGTPTADEVVASADAAAHPFSGQG